MASSAINDVSGKRVFAIGDIHGCSAETAILLSHVEKEAGLTDDDAVVFLGDYIDRGPDTKGVIDLLLDFKTRYPNTRFLKGNHEDMLLDFLGFGGRFGHAFLNNGGLETITSYGISVFTSPEEMVSCFIPSHFKFLCSLESIIRWNKVIFAHAGLNPLRDITAQNDSDVFWIRDEFIANIHSFQHTIIFGHTPHQEILLDLPYKVGIDTGLVFGNKLTCLELPSGKVMQVKRNGKEVITESIDAAKTYAAA